MLDTVSKICRFFSSFTQRTSALRCHVIEQSPESSTTYASPVWLNVMILWFWLFKHLKLELPENWFEWWLNSPSSDNATTHRLACSLLDNPSFLVTFVKNRLVVMVSYERNFPVECCEAYGWLMNTGEGLISLLCIWKLQNLKRLTNILFLKL